MQQRLQALLLPAPAATPPSGHRRTSCAHAARPHHVNVAACPPAAPSRRGPRAVPLSPAPLSGRRRCRAVTAPPSAAPPPSSHRAAPPRVVCWHHPPARRTTIRSSRPRVELGRRLSVLYNWSTLSYYNKLSVPFPTVTNPKRREVIRNLALSFWAAGHESPGQTVEDNDLRTRSPHGGRSGAASCPQGRSAQRWLPRVWTPADRSRTPAGWS